MATYIIGLREHLAIKRAVLPAVTRSLPVLAAIVMVVVPHVQLPQAQTAQAAKTPSLTFLRLPSSVKVQLAPTEHMSLLIKSAKIVLPLVKLVTLFQVV